MYIMLSNQVDFNLRNNFFGLNKQEILIRHEQLINEGKKEGQVPGGPPNVEDVSKAIDGVNQNGVAKGIGYSDIILGENIRNILEHDNYIVAEAIINHVHLQAKGVKTFKLTTDPEDPDGVNLIKEPRVFVGNKQVIRNIIERSNRNREQAQALIDFAEREYIADQVLASQQWRGLSREEKIFHIIARYIFRDDDPGYIIIKLLFGDLDGDERQTKLPGPDIDVASVKVAVEQEENDNINNAPALIESAGETKQRKRKRRGGKRKTQTKRKKKTKRKKSRRKIIRTLRKRKSKKRRRRRKK